MSAPIDRLSVLDASMLRLETPTMPLHSGGIGIFAPGLTFATVQSTLASRLELVPRARQRIMEAPIGGRPVWVDDQHFDLTYHLRHAALPPPGDLEQLGEMLSRVIARPLDRSRPLWEMYVIAGLEGDRTALFSKTHLAMAGGDRGDPFSFLLADDPAPAPRPFHSRWKARPAPSTAELSRDTLGALQKETSELVHDASGIVTDPWRIVDVAGGVVGAAAGLVTRLVRTAPDSPLNVPPSPHRRLAFADTDLRTFRRIRRRFGGTVNDVVVAVCADAVGRLLRWRGWDTGSLDLRVMVPVRIHGPVSASELSGARSLGEGAVGVLAPFPVMKMDPVARLYRVMGELAGVKESRQAVAAESLVRLAGFAPPTLHATAARVVSGTDRYNVALSNAPGPQQPRYLADVRLETSYPYVPLAGQAALSIAVSSYAGRMAFGLLGDRDALADIDQLAVFIGEALEDLDGASG